MLIKHSADIAPSEITDPVLFSRRRLLLAGAGASALAGLPTIGAAAPARGAPVAGLKKSPWTVDGKPTPYESVTTYNNFYEFGPDKDDPARNAHKLQTYPWSVVVDGEVNKPRTFAIEDLLKLAPLEERTYRFRCVEGWSMIVPWVGYSFSELAKRVEPNGQAKFVEFTTLADPAQMPYVRVPLLDWPYTEGLRLDEAMHPLTLLTLGVYGEVLPKQNGAPVRVIVPWKYGFKSAKSLVRIRFTRDMPRTAWVKSAPNEYGFYSNVNPDVPHPRWSQSHERRLGEFWKRPTLPFNGYGEQVASLYTGMDLRKNY